MRNGSVIPQIASGHKRPGVQNGAPDESLLGWLEALPTGRVFDIPDRTVPAAAKTPRWVIF
jgi:hypothetical protein